MATLYLRDDAANWTDAASWSNVGAADNTASGPPTAADDCVAELLSSNVTIDSGAVCRSFDTTSGTGSYGGTISGSAGISIGDGTAGAGNVALKLNSGITISGYSGTMTFVSSSATVQTITTGGKTINSIVFSTGSYQLADDLNTSGSSFTVAAAVTWDSNSKKITMSRAGTKTFTGNSKTFFTVEMINSGASTFNPGATASIGTFTRTGDTNKTDSLILSSSFTITTALNLNGNSATNRLIIQSSTLGTARTITFNGATNPNTTMSNVDFRDITAAGSFGAWDLSAITGLAGDALGNTDITFTTAATQTATGNSANWSTATWSGRVPLPQDDVVLSLTAGQTLTNDMPRMCKNLSVTTAMTLADSIATTIYGSMDLTNLSTLTFTDGIIFEGRGAVTLTSAGKSFVSTITSATFGGSLQLLDALSNTTAGISHTAGTFDANDFSVTLGTQYLGNGSIAHTVTMGNGTWTISGSGTKFTAIAATTVNAEGSTIYLSDTGGSSKTFTGGSKTYNNLQIAGGGAGAVIITGANTFNRIYFDGAGTKSITLPGSATTTILDGQDLANGPNLITFTASAGSATVSKASGVVDWQTVSLTNIVADATGAAYYAGNAPPSVDGGGNTNWIFSDPPGGGQGGKSIGWKGLWWLEWGA